MHQIHSIAKLFALQMKLYVSPLQIYQTQEFTLNHENFVNLTMKKITSKLDYEKNN